MNNFLVNREDFIAAIAVFGEPADANRRPVYPFESVTDRERDFIDSNKLVS